MTESRPCPQCGAPFLEGSARGLCPACLIALASEPWSDDDLSGEQAVPCVGDYELLGEIASGGMGVVFRARQRSLNRLVAVKMIRAGHLAGGSEVQRFRTEAEAAANLDHPNIVPIYEIGEDDGCHFFSMKLVEGKSLAEQIEEDKWSWKSSDAVDLQPAIAMLLAKVARAVQHAHERGVLHRDLKPSNILVDDSGEPHVTDFGLAKLMHRGKDLTATLAVMGTLAYMSPEQAAGKNIQVTTSADIYALGGILYQLLTGRTAFAGDDPVQMLYEIQQSEPPRPRLFFPAVDADLETICLKCLEKSPSRRYTSALELTNDLERWLRHEPILARPTMPWERAVKWVRRHPVTAFLIAALFAGVLLGLSAVHQWRRAEEQSLQKEAQTEARRLQAAENHFEQDDARLGIAALARLLRDRPESRLAAERLVNTLRQRIFLLASTPHLRAKESQESKPAMRPLPLLQELSPDGIRRLLRKDPVTIEVRDAVSGEVRWAHSNAHERVIRSWSWSADGRRIVTASADGTARIWNASNGVCELTVSHGEPLCHAELNPAGTQLVTASRNGTVRLWSAGSGAPLGERMRHREAVNKAHFSPDARLLLTASDDRTARLWRTDTGTPFSEPLRLVAAADDARFSQDGRKLIIQLATGESMSCKISPAPSLWLAEVPSASPTKAPGPWPPHDGLAFDFTGFTVLDVSPDGTLVATASQDKTARLWDTRTRQPLPATLVHESLVNCARFSPDGQRLATSTANRRVRLWDARTGHPLSDWIDSREPVTNVWFSADSHWLNTSAGWRWELHVAAGRAPPWLAELAEAIAGLRLNSQQGQEAFPQESASLLKQTLARAAPTDPLAAWALELTPDDSLSNPSPR